MTRKSVTIESIRTGDILATLTSPRRVVATHMSEDEIVTIASRPMGRAGRVRNETHFAGALMFTHPTK